MLVSYTAPQIDKIRSLDRRVATCHRGLTEPVIRIKSSSDILRRQLAGTVLEFLKSATGVFRGPNLLGQFVGGRRLAPGNSRAAVL